MNGYVETLKTVYEGNGLTGLVCSGIRFVGKQPLPEPYRSRFSHRTQLLEEAITTRGTSSLSFRESLRVHWDGYNERLYDLYRFDEEYRPDAYLSEYSRQCTKEINDEMVLLQDKERFHEYMIEQGFSQYLPDRYGILEAGKFEDEDGRDVSTVAAKEGAIVIKGVKGGGGNSVYLCEWDTEANALQMYGKNGYVGEFESQRAALARSIVTEYVNQATYLDEIYPDAPNTMRILILNPEDREPFIAAGAHRFGAHETGALDNFSQSGLSAEISIDEGTLSTAAQESNPGEISWHDTHPDTSAQIQGFPIPEWDSLKQELLALVADLPELKYAGWDLLVTSPGKFVIIESNHFPDPDVHQVHTPLLEDDRVWDFFEQNGIPL